MDIVEYELSYLKKEKRFIEKKIKECSDFIESESPWERYSYILGEIKNVQGTDAMWSERIKYLIEEGAEIEKNLLKLEDNHQNKLDNAHKALFSLKEKLNHLIDKISSIEYSLSK